MIKRCECFILKKIGIIGGLSPESTIEYYKIITKSFNKLIGKSSFPYVIIDSLDLEKFTTMMEENDLEKVLTYLISSAENLVAGGAEVIIMATNTPHIVFNELEKRIKVPMLSIMDATAEEITKKGQKKVGLIGTKFTMNSSYYQDAFNKYGIKIIVPNQTDKEIINKILYNELTFHIIKDDSRNKYLEVIQRLHQSGAEGVILGCTEIPLLVQQKDCKIPVFDTTTIHAEATLKYAMKK